MVGGPSLAPPVVGLLTPGPGLNNKAREVGLAGGSAQPHELRSDQPRGGQISPAVVSASVRRGTDPLQPHPTPKAHTPCGFILRNCQVEASYDTTPVSKGASCRISFSEARSGVCEAFCSSTSLTHSLCSSKISSSLRQ